MVHADGLALETYVGKRPTDAARVMTMLRPILAKHDYIIDPDELKTLFAQHVAAPGIVDPKFNGEKLAQLEREGERRFADTDFKGAAQVLEEAIRSARSNPAALVHEPKFRDAMHRAMLYFALAEGRLSSSDQRAADAEKNAAKHDQLAGLASGEASTRDLTMAALIRAFPNKVIVAREWGQEAESLYARLRKESDALGRGKLSIDVNDPDAILYVDEAVRGQGNTTIGDLVPGPYRVLVQPSEGDWREYTVDVLANQTARLGVDLDLDRALVVKDWVGFELTDKTRGRVAELAIKLARQDTSATSVSTFSVARSGAHVVVQGTKYNALDGSIVQSGQVELTGRNDEAALEQLVTLLDGGTAKGVARLDHPEYVKPDLKKLPPPRPPDPTKVKPPPDTHASQPTTTAATTTPQTRAVPTPATRDDDEQIRMAKADAIFEEGRTLLEAGKDSDACAKFDQSLQLNPNAIGALLNVARCRENAGKVATAARLFTEARDRAEELHSDAHKQAAEDHLATLVPRLPHLHLEFAEDPTVDTRLVIDNASVPIGSSDIPLDPGTRTIIVSQPGRVSYETKVVAKEQQTVTARIPVLAKPVTVSHTKRTVGKLLVVTGGLGSIGAVGLGFYARGLYNDQFKNGHCLDASATRPMCDPEGYANTHQAKNYGAAGTIIGIASVAVLGVGTYLWLSAPKDHSASVALVPTVAPDHVGVAAVGRF